MTRHHHHHHNARAWRAVPRGFFPFRQRYPLRWADNNIGRHTAFSSYYFMQDAIINCFLVQRSVLALPSNPVTPASSPLLTEDVKNCIGICSENSFSFYKTTAYPQTLELGLCVTDIGKRAVTYRVGVFLAEEQENFPGAGGGVAGAGATLPPKVDDDSIHACGRFVHVFTDAHTHKPLPAMPVALHKALSDILVEEPK